MQQILAKTNPSFDPGFRPSEAAKFAAVEKADGFGEAVKALDQQVAHLKAQAKAYKQMNTNFLTLAKQANFFESQRYKDAVKFGKMENHIRIEVANVEQGLEIEASKAIAKWGAIQVLIGVKQEAIKANQAQSALNLLRQEEDKLYGTLFVQIGGQNE